ncbi:Crp/Fnr family transcriptional regulator [candidate division KSB1 bacterium]
MKELSEYIGNIFLFDSLSAEQIEHVSGFCSLFSVKSGEHLFLEGDSASAFFYLVSGKVKIYKVSPQGLEHTLEILESGSLIAEAAIFDRETYPAYCQTLEDSDLIRIPHIDFIETIERHPDIALKIIHAYSKRLRYFVAHTAELSMQDIKSRLVHYLLDNCSERQDGYVCELRITKKELASIIGTIPETLSRVLRNLTESGMIRQEKNRIYLHDMKRLKKLG